MKNLNGVYKSSNAKVWLNDEIQRYLKSIEVKVAGEFEDVVSVGRRGTDKMYLGYTIEGTMTRLKHDSSLTKLLANGYQTGNMPDIKIITAVSVGGKSERIAVTGITIPEFFLAKFEGKGAIEEEIPFSASEFTILDTI